MDTLPKFEVAILAFEKNQWSIRYVTPRSPDCICVCKGGKTVRGVGGHNPLKFLRELVVKLVSLDRLTLLFTPNTSQKIWETKAPSVRDELNFKLKKTSTSSSPIDGALVCPI